MASYLDQESNSRVSTDDGAFTYKPCFPFVYTTNATRFNTSLVGRLVVTPLFVILGPFIAIFRLLSFIVLQSVVWLCSVVILLGYPKDQPLRGWRILVYKCVAYPAYFIMQCSWFTFYHIDSRKRCARPLICVSNHLAFLDIFMMIMAEGPAFVSKAGVARVPILRKPMEALRVILVRTKKGVQQSKGVSQESSSQQDLDPSTHSTVSTGSVHESTELLRERISLMESDADWRPIHIFPEGTTTTEHGLLRFRTSIFRLGVDVQPICLVYHSYNPPAYVDQNTFKALYSSLTNPFSFVRVCYLDPIRSRTPAGELKDPRAFADEVGRAMASFMGIEYLPYTNEDAFFFRGKTESSSRCSKEYLRDYGWIGTYYKMNVMNDPQYIKGKLKNVFVGANKQHRLFVRNRDAPLRAASSVIKQKKEI